MLCGKFLDVAVGYYMERIGVNDLLHGFDGFAFLLVDDGSHFIAWVGNFPESVVEANFGFNTMVGANPVEGAFDFAIGSWESAAALGVVFAEDLGYVAIGIFLAASAFDDVGVFETNLASRCHSEEFLGGVFHEVVSLHPEGSAEGYLVVTFFWCLGIVLGLHHFNLSLGVVGDGKFDGVEDC